MVIELPQDANSIVANVGRCGARVFRRIEDRFAIIQT